MTRLEVLLPPPRRGSFDDGLLWLALSIPLGAPGLMSPGPFRPFSRAFSPRNAPTVSVSSVTRPSSSTTRAFSSAFDRPSKSGGGIPTRNPKSLTLGIDNSQPSQSVTAPRAKQLPGLLPLLQSGVRGAKVRAFRPRHIAVGRGL